MHSFCIYYHNIPTKVICILYADGACSAAYTMIRTVIITLLLVVYKPHVQFVLHEECSSVGSVVKSTKDIGIFRMVWHLVGLSWQQFVNISQISNTLQTSHIKLLNFCSTLKFKLEMGYTCHMITPNIWNYEVFIELSYYHYFSLSYVVF